MDIEDDTPPSAQIHMLRIATHMVKDLQAMPVESYDNRVVFMSTMIKLAKKYGQNMNKRWLSVAFKQLSTADPIAYPISSPLRFAIIKKGIRSSSGIVNISVVMPPDKFSCKYNCKFCPNETIANGATVDMPRSYLSNEDAVRRGAIEGFDATRQVWIRFKALEDNGHPIDKIEFRLLGGTFSCYPHEVADVFIRDLYYAANTYRTDPMERRSPLTLEEEHSLNTNAKIHVVGVGIETRPDEIKPSEIIRFRRYGITRVELGVQHTNDAILRGVNRGHGIKQSKQAIKLLKEYGFKIEMHVMTDLPNSSPEEDKLCYTKILQTDPDLIPDYMKDYPCLDVAFTEIKKWKADGRWKPYAEQNGGKDLYDVLIYRQQITPKWVRVNRIQRDFASAREDNGYLGFTSDTLQSNLGDMIKRMAEAKGIFCQCIRCSEVRHEKFSPEEIQYTPHTFIASDAREYYICAEVPRPNRNLLLGFVRLRLCTTLQESILPELVGKTAMIRELHVYGNVTPVGTGSVGSAQHMGIGKILLQMAEEIAIRADYKKMAIISGIGVRGYYRRNGYVLNGTYMMRDLHSKFSYLPIINFALFWLLVILIVAIFAKRR
jgi:ELP3 family radical SAM enzyme/protein acetyltransferase